MEEVLPAVQQADGAQGVEVVATEALERPAPGGLRRAWEFVTVQVPAEVRKVTWPSWDELKKATGVIVVFVISLGVLIGLMDSTLQLVFVTAVGTAGLPMPLGPEEVNRLLGIEEAVKEEEPQEQIPFLVGQVVEITEGPFSDFSGTVEEVIPDKGKVRVAVSLFGRPTSVELDYLQLKAH